MAEKSHTSDPSSISNRGPWIVLLLLLTAVTALMLWTSGCRKDRDSDDPQQKAGALGALPGLKGSPDKRLQEELARITDEEATPELLAIVDAADENNVAAGFEGLFPPDDLESIRREAEAIVPAGSFTFNPTALQKAIDFRRKYDRQRLEARQAFSRPACNFRIQHTLGFSARMPLVDAALIYARLEECCAAEALAGDDPAPAVESVEYMLRVASRMAAEKHVTVRLEAAFLRTEALKALQSVANHRNAAREHFRKIHAMMREQLADWAPDSHAWIGDRALGMYLYEVVRTGKLESVLTPEELEKFGEEKVLSELQEAAMRTVNDDELYYLEAMRKIIDACSRPYYDRVQVFAAIREDLHQKRDSPEFPLVAGRLLLPDIEKGHIIQARDRANCEAWAMASAMAAGEGLPQVAINPLTGAEYRVVRENGLVEIYNIGSGVDGDNPPVIVPDFASR
jgi:hypothetical protein